MSEAREDAGTRFFDTVWNILKLNFLWLLACLPLVTIGPATTAAYTVALRWQKKELPPMWSCFWESFRSNFKQAFLAEWVCAALIGGGGLLLHLSGGGLLGAVGTLLLLGGAIAFLLVFPILAKFDLSLTEAFQNCLFLLLRHTASVIGVVVTAGAGACFALFLVQPLLLVMGGIILYLNAATLDRVFLGITQKETPDETRSDLP